MCYKLVFSNELQFFCSISSLYFINVTISSALAPVMQYLARDRRTAVLECSLLWSGEVKGCSAKGLPKLEHCCQPLLQEMSYFSQRLQARNTRAVAITLCLSSTSLWRGLPVFSMIPVVTLLLTAGLEVSNTQTRAVKSLSSSVCNCMKYRAYIML